MRLSIVVSVWLGAVGAGGGVVGVAGVAGAAGATLAAVVVDVLLARRGGQLTGRRLPAVSAVLAALIWTGQMIGIALVSGIGWPVSMWLGAIVLSSAVAAGLAFVSSWNTGSMPTQETTHA